VFTGSALPEGAPTRTRARRAEVHTDAWAGYNGIGRHRFDHVISNVATTSTPIGGLV
jgi:hypothetical protein